MMALTNKRYQTKKINGKFVCYVCGKVFDKYFNFSRHYASLHAKLGGDLSCKNCGKPFSRKDHLNCHKATCDNSSKFKLKCPLCKFMGAKFALKRHYTIDHNIKLFKDEKYFSCVEEFITWKEQHEKENIEKYTKLTNYNRADGTNISYYSCNRNGPYKGKGPKYFRCKTQGTNKINGWCPSEMKVICAKEGQVTVIYSKIHVGHGYDINRIPLNKLERDEIAQKLAAKVSITKILHDIKKNAAKSKELKRIHLLTRTDLENIKVAYKINENTLNVEAIQSDSNEESLPEESYPEDIESSIRLRKEQNCDSIQYPQLNIDDFLLIIMHDDQVELLKRFGKKLICIDTVYKTKNAFSLVTLLILDDQRQSFTTAFLYTNSLCSVNIEVFFSVVKDFTDCIETDIFISDISDVSYKAWCNIMARPTNRYFSSLHVWKAWRRNLGVSGFPHDLMKIINNNLNVILQELDVNTFQQNLSDFLFDLYNNLETKDFATHFDKEFIQTTELWAHCYKLQDGIAMDIQLEKLHCALEYICNQGKGGKKITKFINAVMKFLNYTMCEYFGMTETKYKTIKVLDLKKKHGFAEKMDCEIKENDTHWCVFHKRRKYIIKTADTQCECEIRCEVCTACIHAFYCSCLDSTFKWNMCKHLHYFCSKTLIDTDEKEALDELTSPIVKEELICDFDVNQAEDYNISNTLHRDQESYEHTDQDGDFKNGGIVIITEKYEEVKSENGDVDSTNETDDEETCVVEKDKNKFEGLYINNESLSAEEKRYELEEEEESNNGSSNVDVESSSSLCNVSLCGEAYGLSGSDQGSGNKTYDLSQNRSITNNETLENKKNNFKLFFNGLIEEINNEEDLEAIQNAVLPLLIQVKIGSEPSTFKIKMLNEEGNLYMHKKRKITSLEEKN